MRYLLSRALRIARYFAGWRGGVVAVAFTFTFLAIVAENGAAWYLPLAALASLVLIGAIGTRVNETHAQLRKLDERVEQVISKTTKAPPKPAEPAPDAPTREPASKVKSRESQVSPSISPPSKPDVSVIVTACNERDYVVDCLESIRQQTWRNFECIVVDDESTDDTLELAFARLSDDPRFRFVSVRQNSGLSAARNVGMASASCDWVTFVDGDDYLYEEALEQRLKTLAPHMANHWIAGVYCNWAPVPQNEPLKRRGEDRPARKRISWLDALHDAPFIASAPIVRAKVIRALGGFRKVDAAEDADMWTKVLRHGYVFLPTRYTGIAYRQKANSMFRRETVEHASVTVGLYESNYKSQRPNTFVDGTPFHYVEPAPTYVLIAESFRRNLIALTTAVAQEDPSAAGQFLKLLKLEDNPFLPWVIDVNQVVRQAARRAESYNAEGAATRTELLVSRTLAMLADKLAPTHSLSVPQDLTPVETATVPMWALVRDRQRIHLPSAELGRTIENHVVMTPSAAYHIDELGPMARELSRRGVPVAFLVSDWRWKWTEAGLRSWDFPVYAFPNDNEWTRGLAGIVTLNDWGGEPHAAIVAANQHGVPTFAKIEGVQDFDDVDVPRTRNAYLTSRHVLCQGQNDERALAGKADTYIVGNSRLESIWDNPGKRPTSDLIVVNLNFTWGVLEEARSVWVETVVAATKRLGYRTVFSLHPAETSRPEGVEISDLPMRHLLTQASVLVSRFSTVPFEAMARGVPFVYHNPHGEAVPAFHDPRDAFEITTTAEELAAAIESSRQWVGHYRDRCEAFFREQIDIDPHTRSAIRSAEAIKRLIERS